MIVLALFLVFVPGALCGSLCPPRPDIYPCSCANVQLSKRRLATIVTCRGVPDPASLKVALPGLRAMEMDQLHLVDAFLGAQGTLDLDWLTQLKVKALEVADSAIDPCFICQGRVNCRNSITTRLFVSNSSNSEKLCSACDRGAPKQPWTSCLAALSEFSFTEGRLTSVAADMFPGTMGGLVSLNLSRNQIVKLDPGALRNLPELLRLDLSRNAIEYIDHMFKGQVLKLQHLDISWNFIKSLGSDLFISLPKLKRLEAGNNLLTDMKEDEWKNAPSSLKHIDLSDNLIHCDCSLRWVNGSFPINTLVLGSCSTPPEYSRSPIRRASRFLTQRCTPEGVLGTRAPSTSPSSTSTTTTERPRRRRA